MPAKLSAQEQIKQLKAENRQLKAENKKLKSTKPSGRQESKLHFGRRFGAILLLSFAVALLVAGNILFWFGNTLVKTDRYTKATAPIIQNTEVQKAIAAYTTEKLYSNVDVNQVVTNALPPRAEFLAPTITDQLKSHTDEALQKILANPKFQTTWNNSQARAHERFIQTAKNSGADGSINLNELYQQLSGNLKDTRLAFLADKPLPARVGNIEVASGSWLSNLQRVINKIDTWRTLAVLLFLITATAGVFLSLHRRRAVIRLSLFIVAGMFVTLISLRVGREIIASQANPSYAQAVREAVQIVFNSWVVQTTTLLVAFGLVAFVAWVSGASRSAAAFKSKTSDLFAGKIHSALFSKENGFTLWMGRYKRVLQWITVAAVASSILIVRLTPRVLLVATVILLAVVLLIETLAADSSAKPAKR